MCGVLVLSVGAIWRYRNKVCFDKKLIKGSLEIICHACALMRHWTGLYAEMGREKLIERVNTMLRVAEENFNLETRRK